MAFTLSSKDFRVAERLEHVAAEVLLQVYLAGGAVAEAEPHGVAAPVASLEEFRRTHGGNVGSATRRRQGWAIRSGADSQTRQPSTAGGVRRRFELPPATL